MPCISLTQPLARFAQFQLNFPDEIRFSPEDQIAIVGPNGSGKTLFVQYLLGKIALKSGRVNICHASGENLPRQAIKYIAFKDIYQLSAGFDQYYQKRWNATENEESPLVREVLGPEKVARASTLFDCFQVEKLLEKRLIFLSSGEMRKLQLMEALLDEPQLLIIDNPYIGLDAAARESINRILETLISEKGLQVMLVLCNPKEIPAWINRVLPMQGMTCLPPMRAQDFVSDKDLQKRLFPELDEDISALKIPSSQLRNNEVMAFYQGRQNADDDYAFVLKMNKVGVRYYRKQILKDIDWEVKRGEKWALLGANGSGKSTLLSLVCADNPQAYANDICLFDRKRGSGESIWSIKKRIGYISPEMHHYYRQDISCLKVVASGYFDTIGLYRQASQEQVHEAFEMMSLFHAAHLADKPFLQCSYGEQRLVLLVRVFVKRPPLVILDEPLHGLDAGKKRLALHLIDQYCRDSSTSLIYVTHYEEEIPACVGLRKIIPQG